MDEEPVELTLEDIETILERFVQLGLAEAVIGEDGEVGYRIKEVMSKQMRKHIDEQQP